MKTTGRGNEPSLKESCKLGWIPVLLGLVVCFGCRLENVHQWRNLFWKKLQTRSLHSSSALRVCFGLTNIISLPNSVDLDFVCALSAALDSHIFVHT